MASLPPGETIPWIGDLRTMGQTGLTSIVTHCTLSADGPEATNFLAVYKSTPRGYSLPSWQVLSEAAVAPPLAPPGSAPIALHARQAACTSPQHQGVAMLHMHLSTRGQPVGSDCDGSSTQKPQTHPAETVLQSLMSLHTKALPVAHDTSSDAKCWQHTSTSTLCLCRLEEICDAHLTPCCGFISYKSQIREARTPSFVQSVSTHA